MRRKRRSLRYEKRSSDLHAVPCGQENTPSLKPSKRRCATSPSSSGSIRNISPPSAMPEPSKGTSPIAISSTSSPCFFSPRHSPPVVSFSFVDPGLESLDSFHTHLQAYFRLFCQLSSVRFHYIATQNAYQE